VGTEEDEPKKAEEAMDEDGGDEDDRRGDDDDDDRRDRRRDDDDDDRRGRKRRDDDDEDDRRGRKRRDDEDDEEEEDDRRGRKRRDDDDDDDRRGRRRRDEDDEDDDRGRDRSRGGGGGGRKKRRDDDDDEDDEYDRRDRRRKSRRDEDEDDDDRRGGRRGARSRRRSPSADDDEDDRRRPKRRSQRDESMSDDEPRSGGGNSTSKRRKRSSDDSGDDHRRVVTRTIDVEREDAAFILGRGGSTKKKIARVAGADIDLEERDSTITLRGTEKQCDRAEDYLGFVRQQRLGPVVIALDRKRDDFSAYRVPEDCIGFVMGRNGATLRSMEEEWGVLMFFAKTKIGGKEQEATGAESLCIFGDLAARRGAEIKVMSAVEHKHPGYCVSSRNELRELERVPGDEDVDGWGTETMPLSEESYSYALGAKGNTRRKLATASGCVIEYVGRLACFAGFKRDRKRGKDYLRWLLEQRVGACNVDNPRDRDDCTVLKVPTSSIAFITGHRGESLRDVEKETGTFCFTDGDRNDRTKEIESLLVFSYSRDARDRAADMIEDRVAEHKRIGGPRPRSDRRDDDRYGPPRGGSGGGRGPRGRRDNDQDDDRRYGGGGGGSSNRGRDYDDRRDSDRRRRRRDDDDDDDDSDRRRRRRRDDD